MQAKGKVITISSTKGGPGKTTIVGCIADTMSVMGYKVAVLDVDPNQNFTSWYKKLAEERSAGQKVAFSGITAESQLEDEMIVRDISRLRSDHDFVIVDVAGVKSQSLYVAAGAASLVIIPATPSEDDLKEAIKTRRIVSSAADMISERLGKTIEIPTRLLLNATQRHTIVHDHAQKELERRGFPIFKTAIGIRTVFRQARFAGETPIRIDRNGAGALEIMAIVDEVLKTLDVDQQKLSEQPKVFDAPVPEISSVDISAEKLAS